MNKKIWTDAILGVVVGDALGLPVQFEQREGLSEKPVTGMCGYGTFHLPAGSWSDDSSLTLASLDSLKNGYNPQNMMECFADWLENGAYTPFGEAYDVGRTCCKAICRYMATKDIKTCGCAGDHDNGNGSLMRIMPICLYAYEKNLPDVEAIEIIHEASALTHAHMRSKMACGLYYFMVKSILEQTGNLIERLQHGLDTGFAFYETHDPEEKDICFYRRLRHLSAFAKTEEKYIRSDGYVVSTLEAALWCLLNTESYKESMLKAVNLGADTDTVAAVAGGLAGLYYGKEEIPQEWQQVLQRREWLEEMLG